MHEKEGQECQSRERLDVAHDQFAEYVRDLVQTSQEEVERRAKGRRTRRG